MDQNALIHPDTFQFLTELVRNNSKDWMDEHRDWYQSVRKDLIGFTDSVYAVLSKVDTMPLVDPKKSIARINRNRRFNPSLPPYKENFGLMLKRKGPIEFYIHLEPGNCFVGAGIYHPPKDALHAIRDYIEIHGKELKSIVSEKKFNREYGELFGDRLKTAPRGFDPKHPYIEFLRLKDFVVLSNLKDQEFYDESIFKRLTELYQCAMPFMEYLDQALILGQSEG